MPSLRVRAPLYYQSIPPYYLRDRFTASNGDATRRLYSLTSNLNLAGTPDGELEVTIASGHGTRTVMAWANAVRSKPR